MNISRFFGATNREAMRQVRLALGPDALIVSNKRVNGGVEILAADQTLEADAAVADALTLPPPAPPQRPAMPAAMASSAPGQDLIGAIGDMRGSLENRIDELLWGSQLRRAPSAVMLFQTLLRFGFSTALLRAMLKRLPDALDERAAFEWTRAELVKHLPVLATEDALWRPGLALALVGPTGVGKTTTIAKLAARCVRRVGPDHLVLVTTDTYRIGAHEQLQLYGQMLHVPVHVAQDIHELRRIVQGVRPDQTLLIDNVGISQRDRYVAEQAALLAGAGRGVARLLVLNASSHGDTLDEVARSYAGDGGPALSGCIITKIDEASRLGAALDTAIRYQLPIHYVSNGQKVPEHLLHLSASTLVDHALKPAQTSRTLYAPTEADLAALLSVARPAQDTDEALAAQQRKRLLPQLLTASASTGQVLSDQDLQTALDLLAGDTVLSEGYALWRAQSLDEVPAVHDSISHLRRAALRDMAAATPVLALHGRIALNRMGPRGAWLSSAWSGPDGCALAASAQQLILADGCYAPTDAHPPAARSQAAVLQAQIATESDALPGSALHVFDGGTPTFLQTIEAQGQHWLARCGTRIRVHQAGEVATLSAACRAFAYQPLEAAALLHRLGGDTDREQSHRALWVGLGPLQLRARGLPDLDVLALCVRMIDRRDGRELQVWHGLAGARGTGDAALLGRALLAHVDCQGAWRLAAAGLRGESEAAYALLGRSVTAAQLGLAAWRLWRDPGLVPAASVCARMMGQKTLRAGQALSAVNRLYMLKSLYQG